MRACARVPVRARVRTHACLCFVCVWVYLHVLEGGVINILDDLVFQDLAVSSMCVCVCVCVCVFA